MIQGYPDQASLAPGEGLVLHVATDASRFRIRIYRWHTDFVPVWESAWLRGQAACARAADEDWQWPVYPVATTCDWPSGVYLARLDEHGAPDTPMDFTKPAALFVVRGLARRPLLYKVPLATYHAYNVSGGGCLYHNPPRSSDPPGSKVSLQRPGGGIGGETWGAADYYDPSSPRQTFAHWDAPFIRWLHAHGYHPEFCTDGDLDTGILSGTPYRLLLSVGHDEYWTEGTRDAVESFIAAGGHVAFFGANICWWRIHRVDQGRAFVCHQGGAHGALDHWWPASGAARPEDQLTGLSYRHGGGWWDGPRTTTGYRVQDADHWVFAGTGLKAGSAFGHDTTPPLVGYECDGAPLAELDAHTGRARLAAEAERFGTPATLRLLAVAPLDVRWQELPPREHQGAHQGLHAAVMGLYQRGGTVFTAGSTDWAQVLADGHVVVGRITRNVLDHLQNPCH